MLLQKYKIILYALPIPSITQKYGLPFKKLILSHKKWIVRGSGGIAIIGSILGGINLGVININPSFALTNSLSLISKAPLQADIIEDQAWKDAQKILADFYRRLNFGRYESARELLTADFARAKELYSAQELKKWAEAKVGVTSLVEMERDLSESSPTTKVFSYWTDYILQADNKRHGEALKAFVVKRNGVWTIDTIQDQKRYR